MTSKSQLKQLQELKLAIPAPPDDGERFLVVYPDDWPREVEAAYTEAQDAGDLERSFQILEAQTGQRPSRNPEAKVIHIRRYRNGYGPQ